MNVDNEALQNALAESLMKSMALKKLPNGGPQAIQSDTQEVTHSLDAEDELRLQVLFLRQENEQLKQERERLRSQLLGRILKQEKLKTDAYFTQKYKINPETQEMTIEGGKITIKTKPSNDVETDN